MKVDDRVIRNLSYLCRTYDGITELKKQTQQRVLSMNPGADPGQQDEVQSMNSLKSKLSRRIEKELEFWPIWTEWLQGVPGVGGFIAGNLILLYYYKFVAICDKCGGDLEKKPVKNSDRNTFVCSECGKKAKGEGILSHRIGEKDFPNVSKFWAYMGRAIKDGKMVKREKNVACNYSIRGRNLGFHFYEQVNRQKPDHLYKKFFLERRAKRLKTHPDISKGHNMSMAGNETAKLFLSHFWHVARSLEGKSTEGPWVEVIGKHTGIIAPYYWNAAALLEAA